MSLHTAEKVAKRKIRTGVVAGIGLIALGIGLAVKEPFIFGNYHIPIDDIATGQRYASLSGGDTLGALAIAGGTLVLSGRQFLKGIRTPKNEQPSE